MNLAYLEPPTASGGQFLGVPGRVKTPGRLRGFLADLTSSNVAPPSWVALLDSTRATVVIDFTAAPSRPPQVGALEDIKKRSGFTWDQLARLFGVGRRSMHNWMNGQAMTQEHEDVLHRFREILHLIDDANPLVVRAALRDRTRGASIVDLVADGRFDDARTVALGGVVADDFAALRASSPSLSDDVRRGRTDMLSAVDLVEETTPADRPQPRLKKSAPITRRRHHDSR